MKKRLTMKLVVTCITISLLIYLLYIIPYHKKIFNHFNVLQYLYKGVVSQETWNIFDFISRTAQILAATFFLMASAQALIIRKHLKSIEKQQMIQLAYGATIFFILFAYATINEKWMYIYYGALTNAFFVTITVWIEARYVHKNITKVTPLMQMEALAVLTRFRYPVDKLKALMQILEFESSPDRVIVIREEVSENVAIIDSRAEKIATHIQSIIGANFLIAPTSPNEFALIINSKDAGIDNETQATELAEKIHDSLQKNGIATGIGCGKQKSFENLRESFREAINALDYIQSLSNTVSVHVKDIPRLQEKEQFPFNLKSSFLEEVGMGNFSSANRILEELLPIVKQLSFGHENVLRIRLHELIIAIIETGLASGADKDALNKLNDNYFDVIRIADEKAFIKGAFSTLQKVCQLINNSRESHYDSVIERAKNYIEDHFSEDVSVAEVAESVALSTSYFMALMKKMTGMPFSDYLRNVRIREAKRMIKESNMNMTEIGQAVGIPNSAYFSAQFKKVEGITPSQFKKQNKNT